MNLHIQQSQKVLDTKVLIPLSDQYETPLTVPFPPIISSSTDYYKDSKDTLNFADRFQSAESYHFDSWIEEKTGYNREIMRLYGAKMDASRGIAVPLGTALGNNASKVDQQFNKLPVDPVKELKEPFEIPEYTEKQTRYKNYGIRKRLQALQIQPKRCQTCANSSIGSDSTIYSNINSGVCHIDKIETCGSVWACPVCRSKILNKRQDELNHVGQEFRKDNPGGDIHLLTFTIPHTSAESLADIKEGFLSIFKRLLQSKTWKKKRAVIAGYDRAIETTWGTSNGWHFHIHMLLYVTHEIDYKIWDADIRQQWEMLIKKYLKKDPNIHAFDLRQAEKSDYLAKWAGVNELTSLDEKTAKNGNYAISDFENLLLTASNHSSDALPLSKICSLLFEYYTETKGNRLLTHSQTKYKNGLSLRKYYIQDDLTDEEISTISEDEKKQLIPVAEMSSQGVRLLSENNHFADLKDIFERSPGTNGAYNFIELFPQYAPYLKPLKNFTELPLFYFYYATQDDDPFENELYQQEQRIKGRIKLDPKKEVDNFVIDDLDRLDKMTVEIEDFTDAPF